MKLKTIITAFLLAMALPGLAVTPAEVLTKAKAKINSSKGISGNFKIQGANASESGTFRFDGHRSYMHIPNVTTNWYDGTTMWTLNPRSKEVTVVTPSMEEVRDANPLMYLNDVESNYQLFFSKRKEAGKYLVLLNPKRKGSGIKAIEVSINAKTFMPERFIIRDAKDQRTRITLSGLTYNKTLSTSDFTYPANQYSGYEIVDLR